jgi:hypothetical protein
MATGVRGTVRRSGVGRPDSEYALVAGLYVAALIVPAAVAALARAVTDTAGLYVGFLGVVAGVVGLVGWAVLRTPGLAVGLGRHDAAWLLVALPFGWLIGVFWADSIGVELPRILVPLAVIATGGGMLCGLVLVAMSRTRHADAAVAGTVETVEWEARWPRRWRRVARGAVVASFALVGVGLVAIFVFDHEWGWGAYYFLLVGAPLTNLLNPRAFRATDAGLVVEHPLHRRFRPWSAFESYELTADALVVRPAARWRPSHRCARADIDDPDAVVAALDESLPRRR